MLERARRCVALTLVAALGACGSDGAEDAGADGTVDAGADGAVDDGADGTVDAGADGTVDDGADGDAMPDAGEVADTTPSPAELAARAIAPSRLKETIDTLADDDLGGRICGSEGHLVARDWVAAALAATGLEPLGDDGTFVAPYAARPFGGRFQRQPDGTVVPNTTDTCYNLVGRYPGTDLADEHLVLVAHYDHLGVTEDGDVYNGAFDDGSGTAALLEIARVLVQQAVPTRRSIIFLISDQEEQGLVGAGEWLDASPVPLTSIVAGIAADPLGRALLPDYAPFVISGAERSPELAALLRESADLTDHPLGFLHRMMIPLFGSDHDAFYPHGLPAVWLVSPGMSFYHQPTDDADTIDYRVLRDVSRYLLRVAVRIANDDRRYRYVGEVELAAAHAQDTRDLLVGVSGSSVLGAGERDTIAGYIADLDRVLASDWSAVGAPANFFLGALGYVAFALPRQYPGDIPPPFPSDDE